MKAGDSVDLFAVHLNRWIWRGTGIIHHRITDEMVLVTRQNAHPIAAFATPKLHCTVMVVEIPLDKNCLCLLPTR